MSDDRPFYERPLETLDAAEWEALCDGCGRCCLHKFEDEDTGELAHTWLACDLLDCDTGYCSDYARRRESVPDCLQLTLDKVAQYDWLPPTCAYRLRHAGQPLPTWHPLLTGDPDSVRRAGVSVAGRVLRECDAPDLPVLDYVVDWPGEIPLAARLLQPVEPDSDPGQEAPWGGGREDGEQEKR
ncbi:YcgN family cysteine cluster protein [Thioalkalivibrio sp. ALJ24]|uniref:YcgN family cysteine cluster protein n=1 Tax=Thioalkalivibrio sp. ALJ24 TaxID=545276 RepID=UPI0003795FEF|nr:YcgN family cysteine cluster protein [Thioalkalivibrio sp. ALJ24]